MKNILKCIFVLRLERQAEKKIVKISMDEFRISKVENKKSF